MNGDQGIELYKRFDALLKSMQEPDEAAIAAANSGSDRFCKVMSFPLDAAQLASNPFVVGFAFRSFYVVSATDSSVAVNMRINDASADDIPVKNQSSLKLSYPCSRAFLNWSAQAGKSITVLFFLRGEFSTNQLSALVGGGVSISDGDTVVVQTTATVTSTAAQLFGIDTTRKKMQIMNLYSGAIYLGDSSVTNASGAKIGIKLNYGDSFAWESTAACWAISDAATTGALIAMTKFS